MTSRSRPSVQMSIRTLLVLVAICAVCLPTAIKQSRKHLVYSRYAAEKHERDTILKGWRERKVSSSYSENAKMQQEVQLAYRQAQDKINDRLNSVLKYYGDYNLSYEEMAADCAAYGIK
jgi:DNA-directed RNA polymerase specialized sigma24 family protein